MTANIIPYQAPAVPAVSTWRGVHPGDFDSAIRMAKAIAQSGMAPKSYYQNGADPVAAVFTAMQLGAEIGLSPMTAVRSIAVINGLPGLYGPAMLGVVEASGKLADIDEGVTGEGMERHGWCTVQRVGRKPRTFKFSMEDAKKAKLTSKTGPWTEYPDRMLLARARTFALRDIFPDVLLGLGYSVEELQDIPRIVDAVPDPEPEQGLKIAPPKPEPPANPPPAKVPKPAIKVKVPGQPAAEFSQDDGLEPALREALDFMSDGILDGRVDVVAANVALLDRIAEKLPDMAEAVADLRAAAAMAAHMTNDTPDPNAEPDGFVAEFLGSDDDGFPGDKPLP